MSLFSSIQLASNSLHAAQIGLQVVGNNIANANTTGYIREELVLTPAATQRIGNLVVGMGVDIQGVVQKIDRLLAERLRAASSDLANGETQENAYLQLEALIGELGDTDLSTSLSKFFGAIQDVLNQPESVTVRNLAVLQGEALTADIGRLSSGVQQLRSDINDQVIDVAADVKRLLEEIAQLNVQIVTTEASAEKSSDAVGLRDRRETALADLASLIDIRSTEQPSGAVNVYAGGEYLVFDGIAREVVTARTYDRGLTTAELRLAATDAPISASSGALAGMMASRDEILGGFLDQLDQFAQTLILEFNKVFSSGQGLSGYDALTSEFAVDDADEPLSQTGLPFTPCNGSFQVQVIDGNTGLTETTDVLVELGGLDGEASLHSLAAALDAIDGLSAEVTASRHLTIQSDVADFTFAFAEDTSGVLAALGLSTFFTGSSAADISVSEALHDDPGKFAASRAGVGADTENAVLLADFMDAPLESLDGQSLAELYDGFMLETTQAASVTRSATEGFRVFQKTLESEHLGLTGVSIDEEAVKMIMYQRAYQASARYIAAIDELLEQLVRL